MLLLRPLLWLLACALSGLGSGPARAVTVLETRIAVGSDDAEENLATGAVALTSSDLELIRDGGDQAVGLRFPGQAIPADATITAAWIQFEADELDSGATSLVFRADRTQASPTFTVTAGNVSLRPQTSAFASWSPQPWTLIGEQGPSQRTPSLAAVVQERINATDWVSGDALTFVVRGSGRRVARSVEGLALGAPLLHVEFEPPANFQPLLTIASPLDGATTFSGLPVAFTASATDVESGDVSASITWSSSLDGALGVGVSFSRSDLSLGAHTFTVTASDGSGGFTSLTRRLTVFAPSNELLAAGDIGSCASAGDDATAALLESLGGTILGLGDFAYPTSSAADFTDCFDPAWGRHKARIRPIIGNEYQQLGAAPYFAYFGAAAGDPAEGWYSFDTSGWHVVMLNSACNKNSGCGAGSPQALWLEADLAAHSQPCTLAALHDPRFSSGQLGVDDTTLELWQILYAHGVDVVLHGDDHAYERFARVNPNGVAEPLRGIRPFIVGTGGASLGNPDEVEPNSEVRDGTTYGVLRLTLQPTSYAWQFLGAGPGSFTDSGSETCVFAAPEVAIASPSQGASFPAGAVISLAGTASDLEQGDVSEQIEWSSSQSGYLGTGASLAVTLSGGTHVLTASVGDETGLTGSVQHTVTVAFPPGASCGLGPELTALAVLAAWRRRARRQGGAAGARVTRAAR
jgi:hypothetical protein